MSRSIKSRKIAVILSCLVFLVPIGCPKDSSMEEAAEEVKDEMEDAAEEVKEGVEEVVDEVDDATNE